MMICLWSLLEPLRTWNKCCRIFQSSLRFSCNFFSCFLSSLGFSFVISLALFLLWGTARRGSWTEMRSSGISTFHGLTILFMVRFFSPQREGNTICCAIWCVSTAPLWTLRLPGGESKLLDLVKFSKGLQGKQGIVTSTLTLAWEIRRSFIRCVKPWQQNIHK